MLVVLSTAYCTSEWTRIENTSLRVEDPAELRRKIWPLLLEICGALLPRFFTPIQSIDVSTPAKFEQEYPKIRRELGANSRDAPVLEQSGSNPAGFATTQYYERCIKRCSAPRGFEARRYAWGDPFDSARCNNFESHIRHTTPIGIFPARDTPEGLVDLTGNVWEWTQTLYKADASKAADGTQNPDSGDGRRVVRGGSWNNYQDSARASYRRHLAPDDRDDDLGFRLHRSAHIMGPDP